MKNASPLRLVQSVTLGTLLMILAYAADWLPFPSPNPKHHMMVLWDMRTAIVLELLPFCIGAALVWRAFHLLDGGTRNEVWTAAQRAEARTWTGSKVLGWSIAFLFLGAFTLYMYGLFHNRHWNPLLLVWVANPLMRVHSLLKDPAPPRVPYEWQKEQRPFYSSHWGEAAAPHSSTE